MSVPPLNPQPPGPPAQFCARCGAPNEAGLVQCLHCGQSLLATAWPPPPGGYPPQAYPPQGYPPPVPGGLAALIPTGNPSALTAYYLGIFLIIPCLAVPMGITAVVLGLRGLKLAQQHPEVRGRTHAWVGIIAGGLFALINIIGIGFAVVSSLARSGG